MKEIQEAYLKLVADYFGYTVNDLKNNRSRVQKLVDARDVAMYLLSFELEMNRADVGQIFGRNHSTVCNAIERVNLKDRLYDIMLYLKGSFVYQPARTITKNLVFTYCENQTHFGTYKMQMV